MPRHGGSSEVRKQAARRRRLAEQHAAMHPRGRGKRRRETGWHLPSFDIDFVPSNLKENRP